MPEGDTVHRTARTLRAVLAGRELATATSRNPRLAAAVQRLAGRTVADVEARGKHLLCWVDRGDLALHTHLGMTGSWHTYRTGERWRKPRRLAAITLEVPGSVAVCFNPATCEVLSRVGVERHRVLAALGPDALAADAGLAEARRRLDERAGWAVAEALLDQRVLAGVGNVYKSEVLFVHGIDPWAAVADLSADAREALLGTARRLLRANVRQEASPRSTTGRLGPGQRLYVYGRAGRPCRRCSTAIRVARQGEGARLTYWCPACQGRGRPPPHPAGGSPRPAL